MDLGLIYDPQQHSVPLLYITNPLTYFGLEPHR